MSRLHEALGGIDRWVEDGAVKGVTAAVWHGDGIAATRCAGSAAPHRPVSLDTIFALASVSKPFTAAAVMSVLAAHDVDLDTPLADILPGFGVVDDPLDPDLLPPLEIQRETITFRQALCHVTGLPENIGVRRIRMSSMPSLDELVDAMEQVPLQSAPGAELRYSNLGPALAARAAERIDGRPFHDILQQDILDAMDLGGIVLRPGVELDDRIARVDDAAGKGSPHESYNSDYWRQLAITWGGYYGTAGDVLRFAASFRPGDTGNPLPEGVRRDMVTDQTGGVPGGVHSAGIHWRVGAWGLGWEVKGSKRNHWTGTLTSPSTWCHWGQSGTLVWFDPERDLGLAVLGNRTVATAWPLKPPRWLELSDAVVEALED
jgi:CubicO group peptidase (beta-lactamase class C family)